MKSSLSKFMYFTSTDRMWTTHHIQVSLLAETGTQQLPNMKEERHDNIQSATQKSAAMSDVQLLKSGYGKQI